MNKVVLIGRLTREPEVRYSNGEKPIAVARYSLAVQRKFKNSEGKYEADFINCVAMGKNGEFAEKYLKKGTQILVEGHIQTGSYTNQDGNKVYTTEVMVEAHEFVGSKSDNETNTNNSQSNNDFMSIPDGIENDLPFK